MNNNYRKPLQGTQLEYYDVRQVVEDIQPGAYAKLPIPQSAGRAVGTSL